MISLVAVMENFLGNKHANNYETLVTNLLSAFHDQGYSYLGRFPEN